VNVNEAIEIKYCKTIFEKFVYIIYYKLKTSIMKKVLCMIALAAICLGTVSAAAPVKSVSDTTKVKTKMKHGNLKQKAKSPHMKVKTKIKDTTKK
jgi:hypothetical protein